MTLLPHKNALQKFLPPVLIFLFPMLIFWRCIFAGKDSFVVFGWDTLAYSYYWSYFLNKFLHAGVMPFWNPYVSLGYPSISQISNNMFYPPALLLRWFFQLDPFSYLKLFQLFVVLHFSLAGTFSYLFLRKRGFTLTASSLGGMVYAFSTAAQLSLDGFEWIYGFTWFPLALFFLFKAVETAETKFFVFLALVQGVVFTTNFMPGIYQEVLLVFVVYCMLEARNWKRPWFLLKFAAVNIAAVLLSAPTFFSLLQFLFQYSERGQKNYEFAMAGLDESELIDRFLSPFGYGTGKTVFKSGYFGVSAYCLALVAAIVPEARKRFSSVFLGLIFFIFLFSAGPYFLSGDFFYLFLPQYGTQHFHYRITLYMGIAIGFFAACGFDYLFSKNNAQDKSLGKVALVLFLALAAKLILNVSISNLATAWPFITACCAMFMIWLRTKDKQRLLPAAYFTLFMLEMSFVFRHNVTKIAMQLPNLARISHKGAELIYASTADRVERYFENDRLSNGENFNFLTSQPRIRGYVTPAVKRTAELESFGLNQELCGGGPCGEVWQRGYESGQDFEGIKSLVYGPRVFLAANTVATIKQPDEESSAFDIRYLNAMGEHDLRSSVFIEELIPEAPSKRTEAFGETSVEAKPVIIDFNINHLKVDVTNSGFSKIWLVFVDTFHTDWQATVDGQSSKVYRADYAFKSVLVPPGRHEISLDFVPRSFYFGRWISGFTLLAMAFCLVAPRLRKK